jgi:hypothetical protein
MTALLNRWPQEFLAALTHNAAGHQSLMMALQHRLDLSFMKDTPNMRQAVLRNVTFQIGATKYYISQVSQMTMQRLEGEIRMGAMQLAAQIQELSLEESKKPEAARLLQSWVCTP